MPVLLGLHIKMTGDAHATQDHHVGDGNPVKTSELEMVGHL